MKRTNCINCGAPLDWTKTQCQYCDSFFEQPIRSTFTDELRSYRYELDRCYNDHADAMRYAGMGLTQLTYPEHVNQRKFDRKIGLLQSLGQAMAAGAFGGWR